MFLGYVVDTIKELMSYPKYRSVNTYKWALNSEREKERERERERENGVVGATSTPSTVGLFSFLTMLFLPTFSQH